MSALAPTVQAFFTQRLIQERNASPHTIAAYRECAARRLVVSPAQPGGTRRMSLGPMAYPDPKGERDNSMLEKAMVMPRCQG